MLVDVPALASPSQAPCGTCISGFTWMHLIREPGSHDRSPWKKNLRKRVSGRTPKAYDSQKHKWRLRMCRYYKPAPVYRWQYWSSERGSQSPEVTQPASNRNLVQKYRGEPQSQKPCHEGLGPLSNSAQFPQNLQALCYPWGLIAEPDCPWLTVYSAFFTQLSSMTSQPWCDDPHFTDGKTEAQSE